MKTRAPHASDAEARVLLSAPRRYPGADRARGGSPDSEKPRTEVATIHATSPSPPHPRLSRLRAVTAPLAAAVRVAAPALTSPGASARAAGRACRAVPGPLTSSSGTRGAECRGDHSPLSSSPARRSALRGTPARPGRRLSQTGLPLPLRPPQPPPPSLVRAAAAAAAATRAILAVTEGTGAGSRPARANRGPSPALGGGAGPG